MRHTRHYSVFVVLLTLVTSLMTCTITAPAQADSIPTLKWSAVKANPVYANIVTNPTGNGEVTVGCSLDGPQDLVTYNATGSVIRRIPSTARIDGVSNCINNVAAGANGMVYGIPWGHTDDGGWGYGPNLLAYAGNTLRWKYPAACSQDQPSQYAIGANGNVYVTTNEEDGVHLIGLTPDVKPGTTTPTKVLDIKVPNNCSIVLHPYKAGIVIHGQSMNAQYYSYSGKFLGETPGDVWYEKVNAEGRLFSYEYHNLGTYTSAGISAYNPSTGQFDWVKPVAPAKVDVQGINSMEPLPGGGVAMIVRQQKVDAAGIPTMPMQYETRLLTLNSSGVVMKSLVLPDTDGAGNVYSGPGTITTTSGNGDVLLFRQLDKDSTVSWPSTVPQIIYNAINSLSGKVVGSGMIAGTISTASQSGYSLTYAGDNRPVSAPGVVYVLASCNGECKDYGPHLYPISLSGVGADYPRAGVITTVTPQQPAPQSYVALGDSYSSGEGVPPFEDGTNVSGYDVCHRSELAYSQLLNRDPTTSLSLTMDNGFAACSGATTNEIFNVNIANNEDAQYVHLNKTTKVITLTLGGNDIGFSDFGNACYLPAGCSMHSGTMGNNAYNVALGKINNVLPSRLDTVYKKLLTEAPYATIYVLGYPQVAPIKKPSDPVDARCGYLWNSSPGEDSWEDARAARSIVTLLDAKIASVVSSVRKQKSDYLRLHYVEVNGSGSPFAGHTVCASPGDSYFQNVDQVIDHPAYVFHPNQKGQEAYSKLVSAAIKAG